MNIKNLIKQFNSPESLLVITSFPSQKGEGAAINAVACYASNLLSAYQNRPIVILAEKLNKDNEIYRQDNLLVIPCWQPANPFLFFQILRTLVKFNQVKQVLFQFEFNQLGSVILTSLLPFFLGILGIFGKRITIVLHQVISDLGDLAGHLNLTRNSLKNKILSFGINSFYRLLGIVSNKIIVHEEVLKNRLIKLVSPEKIQVISHGLKVNKLKKLAIKRKDFILLLFGYLTWYKGTDWLVNKVGEMAKKHPGWKLKLIVAGGPSVTLKAKAHYREFLTKVDKLANRFPKTVIMTGFVPEDQVKNYFRQADLVVLPYRAMMSASGPLSYALQFGKPVIMSSVLKPTLNNSDVQNVMLDLKKMAPSDFVFDLKADSFEKKLASLIKDKKELVRLASFSKRLALFRSWPQIVAQYEQVLGETVAPVWAGKAAEVAEELN